MCSFKLTQSQYAHKAIIENIVDQIQFFNQRCLTHISRKFSYYAFIVGISYEVHQYITTGLLPFEEFSDERPWMDKEEW
jgi:hypothetical protein